MSVDLVSFSPSNSLQSSSFSENLACSVGGFLGKYISKAIVLTSVVYDGFKLLSLDTQRSGALMSGLVQIIKKPALVILAGEVASSFIETSYGDQCLKYDSKYQEFLEVKNDRALLLASKGKELKNHNLSDLYTQFESILKKHSYSDELRDFFLKKIVEIHDKEKLYVSYDQDIKNLIMMDKLINDSSDKENQKIAEYWMKLLTTYKK